MSDYVMTIGEERVSVIIPGKGYYASDRDVFDKVMQMSCAQLLARFIDVNDGYWREMIGGKSGQIRKFRSLPKCARAAMVAEWEGPF